LRQGKAWTSQGHFESQGLPPSVEDAKLREIMGKATWPTPSAQTMHYWPAAMQLLLRAREAGDWSLVGSAWKSVAFIEGSVVEESASQRLWLVVYSTHFALLAWPCVLWQPQPDVSFISVAGFGKGQLTWLVVQDYKDWVVLPCVPIGPLSCHFEVGRVRQKVGMWLMWTGVRQDVLVYAAEQGFKGVDSVWLDRLIQFVGATPPKGERANTVLAKVELLVRHLLPKAGNVEIGKCLLQRTAGLQVESFAENFLAATDAADGLLDADDKQEAKEVTEGHADSKSKEKALKEYLAKRGLAAGEATVGVGSASLAPAAAAAAASSAGAAGSTGKRGAKVARPEDVWSARALLPKVKGVVLQPYPDKRRYQVYYPTSGVHQKSKSYTWAPAGKAGFTEAQVLAACVEWAWTQHARETGEEVPFFG
jgi:hypothetical protein